MKASKAMLKSIAKIEKKYGKFDKEFGVEPIVENRRGNGYYDYCILTDVITDLSFTIAHDGMIFQYKMATILIISGLAGVACGFTWSRI